MNKGKEAERQKKSDRVDTDRDRVIGRERSCSHRAQEKTHAYMQKHTSTSNEPLSASILPMTIKEATDKTRMLLTGEKRQADPDLSSEYAECHKGRLTALNLVPKAE